MLSRRHIAKGGAVDSGDVLTILKYAGPLVSLFAAIWSTTQKITFEDAAGIKRLTLPGRVLVGATVVSTLVSVLALGFEGIVSGQKAKAEKDKEAQDKAAEALARLEADGREQNRFLAQRFLIIDNAAKQQQRDAALAQQVAREANRRLAEAERVLTEFDRVNYPLRDVEVSVTLALNFDGIDMTRFWAELEQRTDLPSRLAVRGLPEGGRVVTFGPKDFPGHDRIAYATTGTRISLRFLTASPVPVTPGSSDRLRETRLAGVPGSRLPQIDVKIAQIQAHTRDRTLTAYFNVNWTPLVAGEVSATEKLSLSDAKKLVPVVTIERATVNDNGKRPPDRVEGVTLRLNGAGVFSGGGGEQRVADEAAFILVRAKP
jgi:hypothetical protein